SGRASWAGRRSSRVSTGRSGGGRRKSRPAAAPAPMEWRGWGRGGRGPGGRGCKVAPATPPRGAPAGDPPPRRGGRRPPPPPGRRVGEREKKVPTADVLEALHRATGIPIVADFYTRLYKPEAVAVRNRPLFEALNELSDRMRLRWSKEGPWLQFRSTSYYDDR